jgi:peptidyl-prolyl cis-trans isomerase B (cyclophilin B)
MRAAVVCLTFALAQVAPRPPFFQSPVAPAAMAGKQAVVETSMGTFVMAFRPEAAPNHVAYFMKLAGEGAYVGTTFFRLIKYGIIQGGDPITADPSKSALYGTGGLGVLRAEIDAEPMTAGAVAAVLQPGRPDSGGAQFFVVVTDQTALQGQYTIFARVVEGMDVVQQISAVETDASGRPAVRIPIRRVTIRDTPPPVVDPVVTATPAELAAYRAVVRTTKGDITLEVLPDKAPETVRQFLRLARAGVYDDVAVHRVVPGFVFQTGALAYRAPLTAAQARLVTPLPPEFTDTPNVPGVVSMARGEDPASGSTSFFVCTGECRSLDGRYTVFARVVAGMDVVQAIGAAPVDGETPREPIRVLGVEIRR